MLKVEAYNLVEWILYEYRNEELKIKTRYSCYHNCNNLPESLSISGRFESRYSIFIFLSLCAAE